MLTSPVSTIAGAPNSSSSNAGLSYANSSFASSFFAGSFYAGSSRSCSAIFRFNRFNGRRFGAATFLL
ncbi:hypothetical protein ABEO75_18930 [Paenibacillus macerans]|uniref:hypothetical protein n=1 Tax=Paenibacillus macerans TaxID=44252 RepID=UPI002E1A637C|nr:hypothetical protein [Paenibacillus macerans]